MSRRTKGLTFAVLTCLLLLVISIPDQAEGSEDIRLTIVSPLPGSVTPDVREPVEVEIDSKNKIDTKKTEVVLDRGTEDELDVSEFETAVTTQNNFSYITPGFFPYSEGNNTIYLKIYDEEGNSNSIEWYFYVNTSIKEDTDEGFKITFFHIAVFLAAMTVLLLTGAAGFYLYLRITKNFSIRKYLIRNPIPMEYLTLYIPMAIAFVFFLLGLFFINENPDISPYRFEFLAISTIAIGLTLYTIHSQKQRRVLNEYERAFSQLLFEIADAIRGGIDPAKAIVEISKTDTSIMRRHLLIASQSIKTGRPFEDVLRNLARPTKSEMVERYTRLIAEASKIGGPISVVIHRAAKDMEDQLKIREERSRQLGIQVAIVYIAVGVLLVITYLLTDMYPKLSDVDFSMITNFSLKDGGGGGRDVPKMGIVKLKQRFFQLSLINALGSGLIVGRLVNGKMRYGLVHSMIMMAIIFLVFVVLIF